MATTHAFAEINLSALTQNYQFLCRRLKAGSECASVVKANAYGLGVTQIAPALAKAGCAQFFVATLQEGIQLRAILPEAKIGVFYGAYTEEETTAFLKYRLAPALNSLEQIALWRTQSNRQPAFLHVDTGMNRLGLELDKCEGLFLDGLNISHLITHLACAGDQQHPLNQIQLTRFRHVQQYFPQLKTSFANSSGIFLGNEFHGDLARPGAALYGINPTPLRPNPMQAVVTIKAPVLQVRQITHTDSVGYNATYNAPARARIATLGIGYADGLPRHLSNKGVVWLAGQFAPIIGVVSMDLTIIDISHLPERAVRPGICAEIIGENLQIDVVASNAETIGYELLTRMEQRLERRYY